MIRLKYNRRNTHKFLLCRTKWEYCHIYVCVVAFWQRVFQTEGSSLFKKKDTLIKTNYRPVSILVALS